MKLLEVKYCVQYTTYVGLAVREIEGILECQLHIFLKGTQKYLWISNFDTSDI